MQPPSNDHIPNPKRPSNPFTPSPEPEWVDVKKLQNNGRPEPPPARGSQRTRPAEFNGLSSSSSKSSSTTSLQQAQAPALPSHTARKMNVPLYPGHASQILNTDGPRDSYTDLQRTTSNASTNSLPALPYRATPPSSSSLQPTPSSNPRVLRKPGPPPIPTKKPSLSTHTSSTPFSRSAASPPHQALHDEPLSDPERGRPQPPPPRRSMAAPSGSGLVAKKPVPNLIDGDERPPLPPRTGTGLSAGSTGSNGRGRMGGGRSLMDEEPEEMAGLRDWEVLRPVG